MKYGLTDEEYQFLIDKVVNPLKEYRAQVFLFGSRATKKYQKFSDIDILYVLKDGSENIIPSHKIYQITTSLEESVFPYKVDLVNYVDLAQSYKENVDKYKIEL